MYPSILFIEINVEVPSETAHITDKKKKTINLYKIKYLYIVYYFMNNEISLVDLAVGAMRFYMFYKIFIERYINL